jgi:hypothetical protein
MADETPVPPWTLDPAENAAVAGMQGMMHGMAALLFSVPEARYVDPSGGYVLP